MQTATAFALGDEEETRTRASAASADEVGETMKKREKKRKKKNKKRKKQKRALTLKSADGKEFVVDERLVVNSNVLKVLVGDDDDDDIIARGGVVPLAETSSATLEMVIEFWEIQGTEEDGGDGEGESKDFLRGFLERVDRRGIADDLIRAAGYLDDQELFVEVVSYFEDRMLDITSDEIAELFGVAAPDEEEEDDDDWLASLFL